MDESIVKTVIEVLATELKLERWRRRELEGRIKEYEERVREHEKRVKEIEARLALRTK